MLALIALAALRNSYYLAVINVPAMAVVHVVIFVYLLRRW